MMADGIVWGGVFLVGSVLGLLFYGGLWWTVRRLPRVRHPSLWMLSSFVLRVLVTVTGFVLLAAGDWQRLGIALLGFLLVRLIMVRTLSSNHAIQS